MQSGLTSTRILWKYLYIFSCHSCFVAGVFCAIVSHPADTIVSKLNQQKGSSMVTVAKNLGFWGRLQLLDFVETLQEYQIDVYITIEFTSCVLFKLNNNTKTFICWGINFVAFSCFYSRFQTVPFVCSFRDVEGFGP